MCIMEIDLKIYSKTNFKRKKMIMIAKIFEKRNAYIYIYIYGRNKNEGVKNEECKIFYSMIRMTPIISWR